MDDTGNTDDSTTLERLRRELGPRDTRFAPRRDRPIVGYVETVETDAATGEVVLSVRLDADRAGVNLFEREVVLDGPLFLSETVEESLFDALEPGRGGDSRD